MGLKKIYRKFTSPIVWGNILCMFLVLVALLIGVIWWLNSYTHHGERVIVPSLVGKSLENASDICTNRQLLGVVADSGYNKSLPAGTVLAQIPVAGMAVKSRRKIYFTINSTHSPTITVPDIVDNSSMREATAKLTAMGFQLLDPITVPGEQSWVYGIISQGRRLLAGEHVPAGTQVALEVGDGTYNDDNGDINFYGIDNEEDEWEEIEEPID